MSRPLAVLATIWVLALPEMARAQYKCAQPNGSVSFQQTPCAAAEKQESLRLPATRQDAPPMPAPVPKQSSAELDRRIAIRNAIESRRPMVSMTRSELDQAMGQPDKINAAQYGANSRDQLIYNDRNGRTLYVYVDDGIVTAIQDNDAVGRKKACASPNDIRDIEIEISKFMNRDNQRLQADLQKRLAEAKACR